MHLIGNKAWRKSGWWIDGERVHKTAYSTYSSKNYYIFLSSHFPSLRPSALYGLCLNKQIRACRLSTRSWKSQLAVSTYRAPLIYIELTYTHRSREHKQFLLRAYKGKGLMKQTIAFTFVICLLRAHPFSLSVSFQIGALACDGPELLHSRRALISRL